MTREPNPEHIHSILDEVHDEYDAAEFDERTPAREILHQTLKDIQWQAVIASMEQNPAAHRQLLIELAATSVALIASIDDEPGETDE